MNTNYNRVAVIDVGSNSIKVLVAQRGSGPTDIKMLFQDRLDVRISTGIGATHKASTLLPESIHRGVEAVECLVQAAKAYHPEMILIAATSAVRSAHNGNVFAEEIKKHTGIELTVLSGDQEARGIADGLSTDPSVTNLSDFTAFDLGGGSMEYLLYQKGKLVEVISLPLGAVRLSEQLIDKAQWNDPLPKSMEAIFVQKIQSTLREFKCTPPAKNLPLIGTGGVCQVTRNMLAIKNGVAMEESSSQLPVDAIQALYEEIAALPLERRQFFPGLPAPRADVFPAALAVVVELAKFAQSPVVTHSMRNLRYGLAKQLFYGM